MKTNKRTLEISDFAVEDEESIKENPYQFLNLPIDSTREQVRKAYIRLARLYHPDMVKAIDEKKAKWAHTRMVTINRAYQEIKSRYDPKTWNELFGYEFETVFSEKEKDYHNFVNLEGRGRVIVFPNHFEYWVAGPYLKFDYGPHDDHPWVDWDYRHEINLRHLFAHMEINEGKELNKALLEPFIDCFKLDENQAHKLIDLLSSKETTETIMKEFGISRYGVGSEVDEDKWLYSLRFRRQINEITSLEREPGWQRPIELEVKDGKLLLTEYATSIFSEADRYLFLTLAYGPMLT